MFYFDHNATSPLCEAARKAWLDAVERFIGNPSSPHRIGTRASVALEGARAQLAEFLGCEPWEIIWTSGATESANTAVRHFALANAGEAWVSAIEHPCVLRAVRRYFPERHRLVPVSRLGMVDLGWVREQLQRQKPAFIAVMAANNETGVLQPWNEIAHLCREAGVPFFCDAAQWIGKLPAEDFVNCTAVIGCGHKFGGPQGVGFLKWTGVLQPMLVGGEQEDGRRAGTENVAGVLAMLAALEDREEKMKDGGIVERLRWRNDACASLIAQIVDASILALDSPTLWNTISVLMPSIDCRQRWEVRMDKLGFAVSTGSACASGKEQPSHVLMALGLEPEKVSRSLRISSGWETSRADWDALIRGFVEAARSGF